jgi:cytochrome P450
MAGGSSGQKKKPIFDQVLSETVRLYPPFFQLSRAAKVVTTFQGHVIPEGHIVNISRVLFADCPSYGGMMLAASTERT